MSDNIFEEVDDISEEEQEQMTELYLRGDRIGTREDLFVGFSADLLRMLFSSVIAIYLLTIFSPVVVGAFGVISSIALILGGKWVIPKMTGASKITGSSAWEEEVLDIVNRASQTSNVDPDTVTTYVAESIDSHGALAIRLSKNPVVILSKNLLEECTPEEIESIISHELGHSKQGYFLEILDTILDLSLLIVAPLLVMFGGLTGLELFASLVIFSIVSQGLGNIVGYKLEVGADNEVIEENRLPFVRALMKIQTTSYHISSAQGSALHMYLDEHPPLNHRIESSLGISLNEFELDDGMGMGILSNTLTIIGMVSIVFGSLYPIVPEATLNIAGIGALLILSAVIIKSARDKTGRERFRVLLVMLCLLGALYLTKTFFYNGTTIELLGDISVHLFLSVASILILAGLVGPVILIISDNNLDNITIPTDPYHVLEDVRDNWSRGEAVTALTVLEEAKKTTEEAKKTLGEGEKTIEAEESLENAKKLIKAEFGQDLTPSKEHTDINLSDVETMENILEDITGNSTDIDGLKEVLVSDDTTENEESSVPDPESEDWDPSEFVDPDEERDGSDYIKD